MKNYRKFDKQEIFKMLEKIWKSMPYIVSKTDLMLYQFRTFDTKIHTTLFFVDKSHQFHVKAIAGGHPKMGKEGMLLPFTL